MDSKIKDENVVGVQSDSSREKQMGIEPVLSVGEGDMEAPTEKHGHLHRTLSPRLIHMISMASNVGSGLFIGTGKALAKGGPGNMVIGYLLVSIGVWANLQSLTEMTIAFPTSGNYVDYADRWVDPSLAVAAGFAEWLGWTSTFASELTFVVLLVNYWANGAVPEGALLTILLVVCLAVFFVPNKYFGWLQYFGSAVKVFLFVFLTFLSLAIIGGAGPDGFVRDGSTWTELPAFKNGFGGFSNAALLGIWAVGDQIFIGVLGGEAESPRFSMAHAATLVPWRVGVFYMVSVSLVSIIVPSNDPNLLGGSGAAASPFVIAIQSSGIKGIPDLVNACIIVGIMSVALESIYLPSRMLRTMALQGLIPEFMAKVDEKGRPRWALAITAVVGTALTYMNLSAKGVEVLNWLIAITSASFFVNWAIVAYTSIRFRAAVRAQNSQIFKGVYAWNTYRWPLAPIISLTISTMLLVRLLYLSIVPIDGTPITAYNFFSYTIGLLLIAGLAIAYKIIYRTPWRDPATADLVAGRRELSTDEIRQLDAYYGRPVWRRLLSYVRLW